MIHRSYRIDPLYAEFESPEVERGFREYIRDTRVRDTRLAVAIAAMFYIVFAITDYLAVGAGRNYLDILLARAGVAAFGILAALLAGRFWRALVNGLIPTLVIAVAAAAFLSITLKRPYDIGWHGMSLMVLLLGSYVFIPNRFICTVIVCIVTSLAFLWLMLFNFQPGPNTVITLITLLAVLNILGGMTAYRISRMQHEAYLDASVLNEANAALRLEVTRREGLEDDLREMIERDVLTGLPNRAHFFARAGAYLEEAGDKADPISFLIVDVDYFRQINGTYGHSRGDEVLQTLAGRCRMRLPEGAMCARLGGDDFAFLLSGHDTLATRRFAEGLRADLRHDSVDLGDLGLHFTVSMGLATWYPGESLNSLLRRADQGLSAAKYHGRDRVEESPAAKPSGGVAWS